MKTYNLPDKTHISQICLNTTNMDRVLKFYTDALDFKVVESGGRHASLSSKWDQRPQIILTEERGKIVNCESSLMPHLFAVRFPTVKSLSETYLRLKFMNIPIQGIVHQKVCLSICLAAPDGYIVELYADMPRSAWRWHNGKLLRSRTLLDDYGFLEAIETQENDAGRTDEAGIGRIDFYVQDFERTKRFFDDFLGLTATSADQDSIILAAGQYHQHLALRKFPRGLNAMEFSCGLTGYRLEVPAMQTVYELRQRVSVFDYEARLVCFDPGMMRLNDPCGCALEIHSADCGELIHADSMDGNLLKAF